MIDSKVERVADYGGTYSYRLAEMDSLGSVAYSFTIRVSYNPPAKFAVYQNFPNPFTSTTTIIYDIAYQTVARFASTISLGGSL